MYQDNDSVLKKTLIRLKLIDVAVSSLFYGSAKHFKLIDLFKRNLWEYPCSK